MEEDVAVNSPFNLIAGEVKADHNVLAGMSEADAVLVCTACYIHAYVLSRCAHVHVLCAWPYVSPREVWHGGEALLNTMRIYAKDSSDMLQ